MNSMKKSNLLNECKIANGMVIIKSGCFIGIDIMLSGANCYIGKTQAQNKVVPIDEQI